MKIGILNEELGIAVIDSIEDLGHIQINKIRKQIPEGSELNDLVFFYMADRDWIVINKSNKLYDQYVQLIPAYLNLSEGSRKEAYVAAQNDMIMAAFDILEDVIRKRILIYGRELI